MEEDGASIRSIPWCAKLLSAPDIVVIPTQSRKIKESTEDAIFAETLKTRHTISACLSFHRGPDSPDNDWSSNSRINEINTLVTLNSGLNGYAHVVHGGIVSFLMDEVMGLLLSINRRRDAIPEDDMVTAYLNVRYLVPVATPQTVLVSAIFKVIDGRKIFLEAVMRDGCGVALAKADAMWISRKMKEKL